MNSNAVRTFVDDRLETYIAELKSLVEHESPSRDKGRLDLLAGAIADRWEGLGGNVERIANDAGGDHLVGRFFEAAPGPPALVVGHFDTVWPVGTLARLPLRRDGGRLFGPGVYDMKTSLILVAGVLEAFAALGLRPARPITVLFTSDEEVGSKTSRTRIEALARESAHALILEPPLADGSLKTARKGVGRFTLTVEGKAAHAGVAPELGASAIVELAHQVLKVAALNDPAAGTTLNVGLIEGGTTPNVVPARASAEIDARAVTIAGAEAVEKALLGLSAVTPGTRVTVEGGFNRPPMERSPAVAELFAKARRVGEGLGLALTEGSTGGGSDGNFTAAVGTPTLDGLGAAGGGAHADDEHIEIGSIPERAALLAALLLEI
ncbi:M20 family metallopeptidase [Planctomyces sp. SH-PL62]|uniref:M20 family metallopeptidase n=1 Tax=Planctomyces sp. SH-PL62 TaxID=1636152 RepID=UPI00078E9C27|nr:M20 family metallopeptidase [Planctomyces sp. SH-PL62]AMV40533.1 Carboxypeptidase G2 precursor [Planctomyces sp. SH-PL62]